MMGFLNSLNIAASGMTAQRLRLDIVSENITNSNTTRTENGGPYRRKMVRFEPIPVNSRFQNVLRRKMRGNPYYQDQPGVRVTAIVEDESPFQTVYDPRHPDANEEGYVLMPNVDLTKEMIDSMGATRAYEANITVFNAIKGMATKALNIGQ